MFHTNNGKYNHSGYRPMQNILVKVDIIKVNPYAIKLFYRVQCIWLKVRYKL